MEIIIKRNYSQRSEYRRRFWSKYFKRIYNYISFNLGIGTFLLLIPIVFPPHRLDFDVFTAFGVGFILVGLSFLSSVTKTKARVKRTGNEIESLFEKYGSESELRISENGVIEITSLSSTHMNWSCFSHYSANNKEVTFHMIGYTDTAILVALEQLNRDQQTALADLLRNVLPPN